MKSILTFTAALLMILAGAGVFSPHMMAAGPDSAATVNWAAAPAVIAGQKLHLAESYGKLPLSFEANQGQTDSRVRFLSRGRGYSLFLTADEAVLTIRRASQKANGKGQMAKVKAGLAPAAGPAPVGASSAGPRPNAVRPCDSAALPNRLPFPFASVENRWGQELENPPRSIGAPPSSSSPTAESGESPTVLRMRLVGANVSAAVTGADKLPGKSNYFIGNDPKKWRTNVLNYAKVKYQNVYPGVNLVYYGNQTGQLEYDFVVAPGTEPSAIKLDVGAVREPPAVAAVSDRRSAVGTPPLQKWAHRDAPLQITADGDLVVKSDGGEVRFHKPVVYQPAINSGQRTKDERQRTPVDGHYVLQANNQIGFQVAPYDHTKPLVIDPALSYSTYLGGSNWDQAYGIAVDSSGNAYVTGYTISPDFPPVNPIQATCDGCNPSTNNSDAFVAKLNAVGSALVYSTYLGGSGQDSGGGIAVDSSGNAYVTGYTSSYDFPTINPIQATCGSCDRYSTAFVASLNSAGLALIYSTYLGGSSNDFGQGIALDSSGNAYVTGATDSSDFPTVNALEPTNHGGYDAFVVKISRTEGVPVVSLSPAGLTFGLVATLSAFLTVGSSFDDEPLADCPFARMTSGMGKAHGQNCTDRGYEPQPWARA